MWVPSMAPHIFSKPFEFLSCAIIYTNLWHEYEIKWEYNFFCTSQNLCNNEYIFSSRTLSKMINVGNMSIGSSKC